ncbi:hypothetical protein JCM10213_009174 [Rhodosporidiobolus nylandii]
MDCCTCLQTREDDRDYYQPLQMGQHVDTAHDELLLVRQGDNRPVNLALTPGGLVVLKERSGSFHSLKLGKPSATSTLLLPFLHILSCTVSHSPSPSPSPSSSHEYTSTLTLSALIPLNPKKGDPPSPLKLWTLRGTVREVGGHENAQGETEGERRKCRVEEWCAAVEERAYEGVKRHPHLHIIVNPAGGKGKAKRIWEDTVRPVLEAAGAILTVSCTGPPSSPSNAGALGSAHDPSSHDALVALSGDGIIHELLNGLALHSSGKGAQALRETPVVPVACGSGNALATSLYGPEKSDDQRWAALVALKGKPTPLDLCSLTQPSAPEKRIFSFISQAFGLMADLDLGTEHLRWMGDARFTYGYIRGALSRARYPCSLSVLLPSPSSSLQPTKAAIAAAHNASLLSPPAPPGFADDDALPLLEQPSVREKLPDGPRWTTLPSQEELGRLGEVSEGEEWVHLDLEESGVFFVYGGKVPFVAKDIQLFPCANPNDGLLDLVIVGPMGSFEALTAMDGIDRGSLLANPSVCYLKARAYRLSFEPNPKGGCVSIDGEEVPYEGFQVEVHKGLGRVLQLPGEGWRGRRKVEGAEGL